MILAAFREVPLLEDLFKLVPKLKLVLFDMDGTLIDSEQEHALAVVEVVKKNTKLLVDEKMVHKMVFGCPDPYAFAALKTKYQLILSLEDFLDQKHDALEYVLKYHPKSEDPILKRMQSLISSIQKISNKVQMTVVTASERKTAQSVLNKNYHGVFPLYFTREDTILSKPFPDPYINAVNIFNQKSGPFNHDEILILEDSPYGLAAAMASGINILQACWYIKKN